MVPVRNSITAPAQRSSKQALSVTHGNRFCANRSLLLPVSLRNHWLNERMTRNLAHLVRVSVYLPRVPELISRSGRQRSNLWTSGPLAGVPEQLVEKQTWS